MVTVFILGLMEESLTANISMIRRMVMVHIIGLMAEFMKGNGKMENNTVKANILHNKEPLK